MAWFGSVFPFWRKYSIGELVIHNYHGDSMDGKLVKFTNHPMFYYDTSQLICYDGRIVSLKDELVKPAISGNESTRFS